MATRTISDVLDAAYAAGFTTEDQLLAVLGIGIAESSLDDVARNFHHEFGFRPSSDVIDVDGGDGEWNMPTRDQQYHSDRGLWQISSFFHPEYDDPTCDGLELAAVAVFEISSDGTDFSPWDTYPADVESHYDDALEGWPPIRPLVEEFLADVENPPTDTFTFFEEEEPPEEPGVDDGSGLSPVVRLVTARALPVPHQIQRWVLPIICKEKVQTGPGDEIEQSQDVESVRAFFVDLRRTGTAVVYQEGGARHLVIVRDVSFPEGQVEQWGAGRNGVQGVLLVTIDRVEG